MLSERGELGGGGGGVYSVTFSAKFKRSKSSMLKTFTVCGKFV